MNLEKLEKIVNNRDVYTNILIFVVISLMIYNLDIKYILSAFLLLFAMLHFSEINSLGDTTQEIVQSIKENKLGDDMYYNDKIKEYLKQIHKYKRFNKQSYKHGIRYMRQYFKMVNSLERTDIKHPKQYFENAKYYLDQSINSFQMMTTSLPESSLNHSLKFNDFKYESKSHTLGNVCKELHKECYYILWNISIKLNETTWSNPDVYKSEIEFNSDHVSDYDKNRPNWDIY